MEETDEDVSADTLQHQNNPNPGLHLEGSPPDIILNPKGNVFCTSRPIILLKEGILNVKHMMARHSETQHFCLYPGCKEPYYKVNNNKYTNGIKHIKLWHPEVIPYNHWDDDMKKNVFANGKNPKENLACSKL